MITVLSQRLLKFVTLNIIKSREKALGSRLPPPQIPYFAYGANLDPQRFVKYHMNAKPVGVACLKDYTLSLSLPCEYLGKGYASIDAKEGSVVWGYLYLMDRYALMLLDIMEYAVFRHYKRILVSVETAKGEVTEAFTYISQNPTRGLAASLVYKESLLAAAKKHGFPESYINEIQALPSRDYFELDSGFSLMFPNRRRPFEHALKNWYLRHDRIREFIANKLRF